MPRRYILDIWDMKVTDGTVIGGDAEVDKEAKTAKFEQTSDDCTEHAKENDRVDVRTATDANAIVKEASRVERRPVCESRITSTPTSWQPCKKLRQNAAALKAAANRILAHAKAFSRASKAGAAMHSGDLAPNVFAEPSHLEVSRRLRGPVLC